MTDISVLDLQNLRHLIGAAADAVFTVGGREDDR